MTIQKKRKRCVELTLPEPVLLLRQEMTPYFWSICTIRLCVESYNAQYWSIPLLENCTSHTDVSLRPRSMCLTHDGFGSFFFFCFCVAFLFLLFYCCVVIIISSVVLLLVDYFIWLYMMVCCSNLQQSNNVSLLFTPLLLCVIETSTFCCSDQSRVSDRRRRVAIQIEIGENWWFWQQH